MDELKHFSLLPNDVRLLIMKLIPITFNVCRHYRSILKSTIDEKIKYTLTHHPSKEKILSTIKYIILETFNSISISFVNIDTLILYVFIIHRRNNFYILEEYTKEVNDDGIYSHKVLYRDKNRTQFFLTLNRFFSLFINKYYYSLLYDYHIMAKILYNRRKHPMYKNMNVNKELAIYYQVHYKKEFSYPLYYTSARGTKEVRKINLISFLTDEDICDALNYDDPTFISW